MNRPRLALGIGITALTLVLAAGYAAQQKETTYTGEIMDSPCVLLGGHPAMAQKGESDKDCTIRCVKLGGKYALWTGAAASSYQLDDQKKPEPFAGEAVKVTGTLDAPTKTIKVTRIEKGS